MGVGCPKILHQLGKTGWDWPRFTPVEVSSAELSTPLARFVMGIGSYTNTVMKSKMNKFNLCVDQKGTIGNMEKCSVT